jgi:hypothetical protein
MAKPFHVCSCGKSFSLRQWLDLDFVGIQSDEESSIILRNCSGCGSTRACTNERDLTGSTFGNLQVRGHRFIAHKRQIIWLCACACGKTIDVPRHSLVGRGQTGCIHCATRKDGSATFLHGEGPRGKMSVEYMTWRNMINRCENSSVDSYDRYGAAGVSVCAAWRNSFAQFLNDMGRRPSANHSLDRIDPSGNYEPHNCRWATHREQSRNRRNLKRYPYNGRSLLLSELAEITGISLSTLWYRIKSGWTVERAAITPTRQPALEDK